MDGWTKDFRVGDGEGEGGGVPTMLDGNYVWWYLSLDRVGVSDSDSVSVISVFRVMNISSHLIGKSCRVRLR